MSLVKFIGWMFILVAIGLYLADGCGSDSETKEHNGVSRGDQPTIMRVPPSTRVQNEHWGVRISIDGTNEYHKDSVGRGHDTTLTLSPGESASVFYVSGMLSYRSPTSDSFKMKSAGPRSSGFSFGSYEEVRYYIHGAANAMLIILRTESGKESVVAPGTSFCVNIENEFSEPARLFLFFNTLEFASFEGNEGVPESAFQYNGFDGSRAVFDVALRETANLNQRPHTDLCVGSFSFQLKNTPAS